MDLNPMLPLTLLLLRMLVVVWLIMVSSGASEYYQIAKHGCQDRCGDVNIPYPFGIGEGCYLDHRRLFSVECNSANNRLNFPGNDLSITNISLEAGQFRLWNYVGYDCYEDNQRAASNRPWITIAKPFTFNSTANVFTLIGCDSYSFVQGRSNSGKFTTGCMSICDKKEDVENGACSGMGCCQTSIPSGASQINVSLGSFYNHTNVSNFNPCSFAFVVQKGAFEFFSANLTNLDRVRHLPVVVDWVIDYHSTTCEEAQNDPTTYICGANTMCYVQDGALGYRCTCNEGYVGNPYLPDGCQDFDECGNPNKCPEYSTCVNKMGSYACNCIQGYHEDGPGDKRCVADEKQNKKNYWPIVLGAGLSSGAVILLAFSFCLYFELTRRKEKRSREEFFKKNGGLILQKKLTGQGGGGTYSTRIFTREELQKATNDFDESQIVGRGGFGTVFRGELMDKKIVAIKKSRGVDEHQVEQFINEVILLSQINSRNVVKLLGCCLETEVPLLVYEFINNGTLFEHLHNKFKSSQLSWNIRLRIASEVAGVLSYLHSVASPPIIHRDIKSANILLDQNYTAKVSDFGTSRLVPSDDDQVATMVQGTFGYLDPEYMQTGVLTEKSDVYSFGIVLIELITGKKVVASDKPEAEKFLSNGFLSSLKQNHLVHVLDASISYNENMEQMMEVAMIAKRCIGVRGEDRPCMKDVERELEVLGKKAPQISSVQVFEIDSSKSEALFGLQPTGYGSYDGSTSSGQYSVSFTTTTERPLLSISGTGR